MKEEWRDVHLTTISYGCGGQFGCRIGATRGLEARMTPYFGYKNLLKQFSEQVLLLDGNQVTQWRGVGDGLHPACRLTRLATGSGFE